MKKALVILLTLAFACALCACSIPGVTTGNGQSQTTEQQESKPAYLGEWKMESYQLTASLPENAAFDATMNIYEDNTFAVTQVITSGGASAEKEITGTYTADGDKLTLTSKHATTKVLTQTSEEDLSEEFSGTVNGDKLVIDLTDGTTITMKKA